MLGLIVIDSRGNIASRSVWILWHTGFVPDGWSDRRDALPQGCVLRDYTVQEVLGHGGFGIVYKARHNELDQVVAIKEYLPSEFAVREGATVRAKSADCETYFADGLRRFRKEAQALIDFQRHPSTVACSEFFRANGTAYLVMEYVDGQPLSQVLREREAASEPFTESDLLAIAVPLAEGLAHIHKAGVIHRDIKPGNILVRRADRQPVLIDFGAAKQAVAEHSRSLAPYTEGYAALEQVADGRLGPWTDLYGYGAVLWRMVAGGNRPWEPPNPVKVEQRSHAVVSGTEDPMPLASELGEGRFPAELLEVIDGCLRLRETERVQGSGELLEVLRGVSESPAGGVAETARPVAERTGAKRPERGSGGMQAGSAPRAGSRGGGDQVLAGAEPSADDSTDAVRTESVTEEVQPVRTGKGALLKVLAISGVLAAVLALATAAIKIFALALPTAANYTAVAGVVVVGGLAVLFAFVFEKGGLWMVIAIAAVVAAVLALAIAGVFGAGGAQSITALIAAVRALATFATLSAIVALAFAVDKIHTALVGVVVVGGLAAVLFALFSFVFEKGRSWKFLAIAVVIAAVLVLSMSTAGVFGAGVAQSVTALTATALAFAPEVLTGIFWFALGYLQALGWIGVPDEIGYRLGNVSLIRKIVAVLDSPDRGGLPGRCLLLILKLILSWSLAATFVGGLLWAAEQVWGQLWWQQLIFSHGRYAIYGYLNWAVIAIAVVLFRTMTETLYHATSDSDAN